jgi:hypothetical protein
MPASTVELLSLAHEGIAAARQEDWEKALPLLAWVGETKGKHQEMPGVYYSFLGYGIAKMKSQKAEGLRLCEHAVQVQFYEADNHWNLARVRLLTGDRKGAVRAATTGTRLDPQHVELASMRQDLGLRRGQVFPQLDRGHALNRWFGQLRHALFGPPKA